MTRPVDPNAMRPSAAGSTRTAPPQVADDFWWRPRMRTYLLFDATGIIYTLIGLLGLRVAWALRDGADSWAALMASFANPLYVAFHVLALVSVLFVGVRFFRLFPKAQPPRLGPAKPPPAPVLNAMLYAAWIGATAVWVAILGGIWP